MEYKVEMLITLDPVSGKKVQSFFADLYDGIPFPIEADFWINIFASPDEYGGDDYVADIGGRWKPKENEPNIYFETKRSHENANGMFYEIIYNGKSAFDFIKENINQ